MQRAFGGDRRLRQVGDGDMFDPGRLADLVPNQALHRFWGLKLQRHPTFLAEELAGLAPQFAAQLQPEGVQHRAERLCHHCHNTFLPGLTRYYFKERVPNFYANGIAM